MSGLNTKLTSECGNNSHFIGIASVQFQTFIQMTFYLTFFSMSTFSRNVLALQEALWTTSGGGGNIGRMGENRGGREKEKTGDINPCKVVAKDQIILV